MKQLAGILEASARHLFEKTSGTHFGSVPLRRDLVSIWATILQISKGPGKHLGTRALGVAMGDVSMQKSIQLAIECKHLYLLHEPSTGPQTDIVSNHVEVGGREGGKRQEPRGRRGMRRRDG